MKKIEWPKKMILRNGLEGRYLGVDPATGRHRVQTQNISSTPGMTTWLLDDYGRCYVRGEESELDFAEAI